MTEDAIQPVLIETERKTPLIYKVLVVAAMIILMGGTLTGVMTYMNLGYTDSFFNDWFSSFFKTALVMMPIGFSLMTLLTKLVNQHFPDMPEHKRNMIIGPIMALVMESIMAFTTTANNIGFADSADFASNWFKSFIVALPVALVLMTTISLTIKPKIERFLRS